LADKNRRIRFASISIFLRRQVTVGHHYDGAAKQQTAAWLRHVDRHQIPALIILLSIQPVVTVLVSDDYGVLANCRIKFNVQNPLDSVQVGNNIVRQSIQLSSNQTISRNYNLAPNPVGYVVQNVLITVSQKLVRKRQEATTFFQVVSDRYKFRVVQLLR